MNQPTVTKEGKWLTMPGMASVHSHAFQRAMRGLTQRKRQQAGSFWSWRGVMYRLAEKIDPDTLYAIARLAYLELAMSGVTLVGEFHYLHHQSDGTPYAEPTALADACIRAARDVGIRICLIRAAYMRGGFEQPLLPAQRRFRDLSTDHVIQDIETLQARYKDDPLVSLGVAAHSVRAVRLPQIRELASWAQARQLPFHMHVCEQRRELEECRAEHGVTPVQLLADHGILGERFVAVHATHLDSAEINHLGQFGCFVTLCRTTERDLGDGLPPTAALVKAGTKLTVGVDSHCGADAFEELRAIELDARSQHEARAVVGDADLLLQAGTQNGYAACGVAPQWHNDTVQLDAHDLALVGLPATHLVDGTVFAATPRAVCHVTVNGRQVVENGRHADEQAIKTAYEKCVAALQ